MKLEDFKHLSVLTVDDDPDVLDLLETFFSTQNLKIRRAENGCDALEKLKEEKADLVITDLMMPKMNGIELLKNVAEKYPDTATLMLTSMDETKTAIEAMKIGAFDYILKPVDFSQLTICVTNTLARQQIIRENRAYKERLENIVEEQRNQLLQADKLSAIGMLISGICHEINNPLSFLKSNLELLDLYFGNLNKTLEEYAKEHPGYKLKKMSMKEVIENVNGMLKDSMFGVEKIKVITDDIMGFSRKKSDEQRRFSVKECVEASLNLARFIIKNKVTVKTEFADGPLEVFGQHQKMEQIFLNLFQNAVYALKDKKGPELCISARNVPPENEETEKVVIEVKDNGPGMTEEVRDKIFEPYFTTKPAGEGTGLGLSISKDIIKGHGGTIQVRSELGEGTTFIITLPAFQES